MPAFISMSAMQFGQDFNDHYDPDWRSSSKDASDLPGFFGLPSTRVWYIFARLEFFSMTLPGDDLRPGGEGDLIQSPNSAEKKRYLFFTQYRSLRLH